LVKERGFTLEGAKTHLKENKGKTLETFDVIRKLETVKSELLKIKDQL
jgi:hypothetical protein